METGIKIGTVVEKDSLQAIVDAITQIMNMPVDQETMRHGIDALGRMARVENVTIQNCVVNGDRSVSIEVDAENGEFQTRYVPKGEDIST